MATKLFTFLSALLLGASAPSAFCQQNIHPAKGLSPVEKNYTKFYEPTAVKNEEVIAGNKGYENDPELGVLYEDAPCTNCYELIGKRTLTSKTYAKAGTKGRDVLIQNATSPLHYKDANGKLRTLLTILHKSCTRGVYAANEQELPIIIDATKQSFSIGTGSRKVEMNRNLELVYIAPDGTEQSLGIANWGKHTAGVDGAYVPDAWPGVDIEMYVIRGGVKTNYIINQPMPAYAAGKLVVRDHMLMAAGLSLNAYGHKEYGGNIEVDDAQGVKVYGLSRPIAYEKEHMETTTQQLSYTLQGSNTLDIGIPGNLLSKGAAAYPLIIDPLILDSTVVAVPGSSYTNTLPYSNACTIVNNLVVPAGIEVNDIMFTFTYMSTGGATMANGAYEFYVGSCKSPSPYIYYWYCNVFSSGSCTGVDQTFYPDVQSCIPAPTCSTYVLPVTMYFYQTYSAAAPCTNSYITATTPLTVIISGHTVEMQTTALTGPATICEGDKTTAAASGHYGVSSYTYRWMPGGTSGQAVTLSPTATTVYTCTITDMCGNTDSLTATVNVLTNDNKGFTIAPAPACINSPITISGLGTGAPACYNWLAPGSSQPAVTNQQTWVTQYSTPGKYDITLNYQNSFCLYPSTMQVEVLPLPVVITPAEMTVCEGSVLNITATSPTAIQYQWTKTGTIFITVDNPIHIAPVKFADAGTYEFLGTDKYGCVSLPAITKVSVVSLNLGAITASQTIHYGSSVQLDIAGGTHFVWSPDNGTLSNPFINNPVATPVDSVTTYTVLAMDDNGCRDSASVTIKLDYSNDFIPTAFTPNGDGLNDIFKLGNARFDRLANFEIYDRWGQVIFRSTNKNVGWDGTYKGEPMDMGVYHYIIMLSRPDNSYEQIKGDVTLIR